MKNRPDTRLPISRPSMSLNATMTVSISPAATSRSSSSRDKLIRWPCPSPGTCAQDDLGGQLRRRLVRIASSEQLHHPVITVDEALAGARHGVRGGVADQGGCVDLDRWAVLVANHAGEVGDPWVTTVDGYQAGEPVQPRRGQVPRQFGAVAIADQ